MQRFFVIRGFGSKKDTSGRVIDFERVHHELIAPALAACGLVGGTTAEIEDAGNIRADMFALILEADLVICDITVHNANVFYELGIRHALRKKHTLLIKGDPSSDTTPFDLSTDRYLKYPLADPAAARDALVQHISASLRSARDTDSPIFLLLPGLREADAAELGLLPLDFVDEVDRAQAAGDKGWLRVMAEDVRGLRFQWDGLRRVARAQWLLKDLDGARLSWETLRHALPGDREAHLALANLYEREYRATGRAALLEASNQAIRQVLQDQRVAPAARAEALALEGRNLKTLWRARFESLQDPQQVQLRALDIGALQSYHAYRAAFEYDLNAYYPGLAALQMGHILCLLSSLPGWRTLFNGRQVQADRARQDLEADLAALTHVVAASIRRARSSAPDDAWAAIAEADLLFLTLPEDELQPEPATLVQAYRAAIPANHHFASDAITSQLALFARIGLRADAARAVITALGPPAAPVAPAGEHLVVFAGHRVDAAGASARFPPTAEARARQLLAARLRDLQQGQAEGASLTVLASAAPGADILLHEVCQELGVRSRLCLPMSAEQVARLGFGAADHWRSRFLGIVNRHQAELLQLDDDGKLPRWLQGRPGVDVWERGNRWVMQLAQSWGARRVTLLALWDGVDDGGSGGTAQLVRLARASGRFEVDIIDSRALLD